MSDLGRTLRQAREQAGLSLSGMANRCGYSRSYLGNVETGVRAVTPDLTRAYERVLGEDLKRRQLLLGSISALAASSAPDAAVSIASDVRAGRNGLLTGIQTTHSTDKAVASLVSQDSGSVMSLVKWAGSGNSLLRVNAAGILAKMKSPTLDNEAVTVLRTSGEVRELYLTTVASRVLSLPWDDAASLAASGEHLPSAEAVQALSAELGNPADAGARWCSAVYLARTRDHDPAVTDALVGALRTEPSREVLRTIGSALAGIDPL
jgi:transcriptional regulator with XRE-family HTH domain